MNNYRGTSWKRETAHPLPFTGFVMPLTAVHEWRSHFGDSPPFRDTGDRTVHHGFRIAKERTQDRVNNDLGG